MVVQSEVIVNGSYKCYQIAGTMLPDTIDRQTMGIMNRNAFYSFALNVLRDSLKMRHDGYKSELISSLIFMSA